MYRPLPESVTIKESKIDGLGVFATEKIKKGAKLGISHVWDEKTEDNYWRTPLGGFINHSDDPNCYKETNRFTRNLYLKTNRVIKKGEELTVKYTLYGLVKNIEHEDIENMFNMKRGDPFREGTG
tara:strand:+ start:60 stop:434 length:375 start_codon:yes stop_codon:yes gene_type:complete